MTERFYPRATVFLAVMLAAAPLAGCVVPLVAGTAAGGYTLVTEQRSPEQLARDAATTATAHKYWADASSDLARDVSATAYDNELLITGLVPNQQMKDAAERLARQVQGVTRIYNEVQVGPLTNFGQDARDNYVSNALRTQLLADTQVRSSNYIVHTLNGIVYIMGYARNGAERELVLSYARNLPNVSQVKSYIKVGSEAGSPPASAGNASGSGPPVPPPPEAPPAPAPRGSAIEVQPIQ
ncbi:MAG TPA: BON domain-containing protein [Stellaceae bacterium]